jgi:putative Mg2+ transporter-C (MgtC) family protein
LRTFPLVAVASCGFVQATEASVGTSAEAQARIIEGVITGIGLIGAGPSSSRPGLRKQPPQPQVYGQPA